jgi:Leucine-rich repeat (LRR) protein
LLQVERHTNAVAGLKHLVKLDLSFVSPTKLSELPAALGGLSKLRVLDLHGNTLLPLLPERFTDLKNLEDLNLSFCGGLPRLPQNFSALAALTELNLQKAKQLSALEDIGALPNLRHVNISRSGVTQLPTSFSNLQQLETLSVVECRQLTKLCPNFGVLQQLPALDLSSCEKLQSCDELLQAPEGCKPLSQLTSLSLARTGITALPAGLDQLINLQQLDLSGCKELVEVPSIDLPCLEQFHMSSCPAVEKLHIKQLPSNNLHVSLQVRWLSPAVVACSVTEQFHIAACCRSHAGCGSPDVIASRW